MVNSAVATLKDGVVGKAARGKLVLLDEELAFGCGGRGREDNAETVLVIFFAAVFDFWVKWSIVDCTVASFFKGLVVKVALG